VGRELERPERAHRDERPLAEDGQAGVRDRKHEPVRRHEQVEVGRERPHDRHPGGRALTPRPFGVVTTTPRAGP
jgi:hypothetical protein